MSLVIAGMGKPDGHRVLRREQSRRPGLVRIREQKGIAADTHELVMQVLGDEQTGPDAEQQDARGGELSAVTMRSSAWSSMAVTVSSMASISSEATLVIISCRVSDWAISAPSVRFAHELRRFLAKLGRQRHAQLRIAGKAERSAKAHDGGDGSLAGLGQFRNRLVEHDGGVFADGIGEALLGRRETALQRGNGRLDSHPNLPVPNPCDASPRPG